MHRYIDTRTIEGVRLALRSDGAIWIQSEHGEPGDLQLDRGAGWLAADRIHLCHGDRLRLGATTMSSDEVCRLFEVEDPTPGKASQTGADGNGAPRPIRISDASLEKARRNPGTGQIEPLERNQDE